MGSTFKETAVFNVDKEKFDKGYDAIFGKKCKTCKGKKEIILKANVRESCPDCVVTKTTKQLAKNCADIIDKKIMDEIKKDPDESGPI